MVIQFQFFPDIVCVEFLDRITILIDFHNRFPGYLLNLFFYKVTMHNKSLGMFYNFFIQGIMESFFGFPNRKRYAVRYVLSNLLSFFFVIFLLFST